ncbi:MAG TPA: hypothetical protein DDW76_22935 [Cyanobacteria bacterium UBA11369]|nr:hypothetical protein [Cyanobacteria bacterium UBA11371]HBE31704.1 hypothetical protein [Cyanobacteria bacterium UBA11368]HBE51554.1 hypothetical protein [Cyanobacteria bacterium UBA11369]
MHEYQKRSSSPNHAALQAYQRKRTALQASSSIGSQNPTINRDQTNLTGKNRLLPSQMLEARMMARMQQANAVVSTDEEQLVQGKGDWQQKADLNAIFSNGSPLSSGLMAKYEHLMPGVSLGHVSLHQGSQVDAALQTAGLHGLTDGTNVAVASTAPSGTLEHELGHVGQRQEQGFSLDEGNRQAHEKDADEIAGKLLASQPVERFEQTASAKKRLLPSQMLEARMMARIQARCAKCDSEEQQALSKPMALDVAAQDETQAKATGIEQAVSFNEISNSSNTPIAESSPKLQAAATLMAPTAFFGPVGVGVAFGIGVVTIVVWLNNGGWQQIGEIADAIGKGIEGTLQELREILNRAGEAGRARLREIEEYIGTVLMAAPGNQADTGIMQEANELIAESEGKVTDICEALDLLMKEAKRAKDTNKIARIKATQKAKGCRHSRHS